MAYDTDIYNQSIAGGMPPALALLIVAQAKHETGNFSSSLFQDCNNAFGFGYGSDWCGSHNYTGYNAVTDSVTDLTDWIKNNFSTDEINNSTTPLSYATNLHNHGYYTDTITNYANGLANWFTTNISTISEVSGIGIVAGIAIFFILFRKELHVYKKQKSKSYPDTWRPIKSKF